MRFAAACRSNKRLLLDARPVRAGVGAPLNGYPEAVPDNGQVLALRAILEIQQAALGEALTPDAIMARIAQSAVAITSAKGAVMEVIEGDQMHYAHCAGSLEGTEGLRLSIATSLSGLAVTQNQALRSNDAFADPRVDHDAAMRIGVRSMVIVPLTVDGTTLAVLKTVSDDVQAFTDHDVEIVTTLASFAARVLQQTQSLHDRRLEQETYRLISQTSTDAILQVGLDGRILWASPAAREILGHPPRALVGMAAVDLIHPQRREEYAQRIAQATSEGADTRLEYPAVRPDGSTVWVESAGRFARDEQGALQYRVVRLRDISAAREAVEALAQSENQFRSAMQNAPIGMCLIGTDGSFLQVNEALCQVLGRPEQVLMRSNWQELTHPDDVGVDLDFAAQALSGELDQYRLVKRYLRPDGAVVWGDLSVSAVRDSNGAVVHFVSQILDISELKQEEQQSAATINRYHRLAGVGNDVMAELTSEGVFVLVSPNTKALFGVDAPAIVGDSLFSFVPSDQRSRVRAALQASTHFELPVRSAHGRISRAEAVTQVLPHDPDGGLVIRIRDITEHFETREQLRTQARTDPLTGLLAWQELERRLEALLGHEPRTGTRTAFAMMEVGGVGQAREQHSEAVADELLRIVADRIRGALRESDLVARGEGDQLAVMLVGVERMTDAVEVLQRVIQEVGTPHAVDGSVLRPRLSIGVTEALPDEWPEWVISRAEQALDNSKNRGGNRVSLAGGLPESSASAQVIAFPGRKG